VVFEFTRCLLAIGFQFYQSTNKSLLDDRHGFLLGSTRAFFDAEIPDEEFVKYKESVGDIDLLVNEDLKQDLLSFLNNNEGHTFHQLTLIGHKTSPGQIITLWRWENFGINIQIDFVLAPEERFEWVLFSHSASWEDMKVGIKGVGHKYLLSSLASGIGAREVLVKGKTTSGDKIVKTSLYSFSVMYGLRQKLLPLGFYENGLEACAKIAPDYGITNKVKLLRRLFVDTIYTKEDLEKMDSFVGLVDLMNTFLFQTDRESVIKNLFDRLWGDKAQRLYRYDKERDFDEKYAMMKVLEHQFSKEQEKQVEKYYKEYK
jgi:hypothetical protein